MTTTDKPMHTPTPWTTFGRNILADNADGDDLIVACVGHSDGTLNQLRVPAKETNIANAALIVRAVNSHEAMREALELTQKSETDHANCEACDGEIEAEQCEECFPLADKARLARRAALALADKE